MSKKLNNRNLIIILVVLIGVFVFIRFYRASRSDSSMRTDIVEVDTAKVSSILIYPNSQKGTEIKIYKEGKNWKVTNGKIVSDMESDMVQNLSNTIIGMKALRLAARSKDKWGEFQVNDSAGTRVKVLEGKKIVADFVVGKFTYQQSPNPYGQYGGGGGGVTGTTFVRNYDEDEIYAVNGFLTFTFNQEFNSWRTRKLSKVNTSDVSKVIFKNLGDSSATLTFDGSKPMVNGQLADSTKVASYLQSLSNKNGDAFNDEFIANAAFPVYELTVEGKNMLPINIKAYAKDSMFVVNSSANPKAFFNMDVASVAQLFKGSKAFEK